MKSNIISTIYRRLASRLGHDAKFRPMFLAVLLLQLASPDGRAAGLAPANAIHQMRSLYKQSFQTLTQSNRHESFEQFRRILSELAAADNGVRGNTPEQATLLDVARGVSANPRLLDELLATYGAPLAETHHRRVLRPQPPRPSHLTESYRPSWEALLLAPISAEIAFMQSCSIITDALFKIGNPKSLPVLELAFTSIYEPDGGAVKGSRANETQFRIVECLNRFATKESLQAMLRCLGRAEAASPKELPKYAAYDMREWVERFLTDKDNYGTREKWRQVLSSFPKDNLPADQRELLDRATRQE